MRGGYAASLLDAVAELDDATVESLLVDELEIDACVDLQGGVAPTEDDWPDEQNHLVDQPGDERRFSNGVVRLRYRAL